MFLEVDPQQNFPEIEEEILKYWEKNKIFQKTLENRADSKKYIFYDGPPFANGLPHYGHILAMTIKDVVTRYKTMAGFSVPRRGGWDTHGLPVEFEVEKDLKLSGKKDIENYGVGKFNEKAKESVFRYQKEWEKTMARMGRWIDFSNAYTTMDRSYMESVWWVFSEIYKKDLIYEGYKSLPYCSRCGTPLSNFEVNQGYKDDVEDPSVIIKFKISSKNLKTNKLIADSYLLAWTTTPWTLPGNTALAVGKNIKYVKIKKGLENYILAKDRLSIITNEYKIVADIKSIDLIGLKYEPLFDLKKDSDNKKIYEVVEADFITTEDGTGIVHIAPAFGENDLLLAQEKDIAIIKTVDTAGNIDKGFDLPAEGEFVKDADSIILEYLEKKKLVYSNEKTKHTYPFCWRCDSPLIYYAMTTWFIKVSAIRKELLENNKKTSWTPTYLKDGRFGKWLADARDWAVSRNRYWGAPLPVWKCEKCHKNIVIGSLKELEDKSNTDITNIDLHKPTIDEVELNCDCGGKAKRVSQVLDCWFESGAMPYASNHYPFENKDDFDNFFPADFIAEGLDQTRGWFYTLMVLSTILFEKPAYKNVIVNGIVLATDGKKLSKRLKNYDEPEKIFSEIGVDPLRYFLLSSTPMGEDYRFSADNVKMQLRKVILPLWNTLSFFTSYANLDNWDPSDYKESENILDKWMQSRLNYSIKEMTEKLESYDLTRASRQIEELITDLSVWYLRRSRKRRDGEFYSTSYETLKTLSIMIAPFLPFLAENVYQILKTKKDPESVHLCDWVKSDTIDSDLLEQMRNARKIVELTHAKRNEEKLKVRQPLAKLEIKDELKPEILEIIKAEVNVKEVVESNKIDSEINLDTKLTPELIEEGSFRELLRQVQDLRKKAGFNATDMVELYYETTSSDTQKMITKYQDQIKKETNIKELFNGKDEVDLDQSFDINKESLWLGVKK